MQESASAKRARRSRLEAHIRILAGDGVTAIHWSADERATVLGPDGMPYLRVEPTDPRGQMGIRVIRLGNGRHPGLWSREGHDEVEAPSPATR